MKIKHIKRANNKQNMHGISSSKNKLFEMAKSSITFCNFSVNHVTQHRMESTCLNYGKVNKIIFFSRFRLTKLCVCQLNDTINHTTMNRIKCSDLKKVLIVFQDNFYLKNWVQAFEVLFTVSHNQLTEVKTLIKKI